MGMTTSVKQALSLAPKADKEPLLGDTIAVQNAMRSMLSMVQYGRGVYPALAMAIGWIALSGAAVMGSARLLGMFIEGARSGVATSTLLQIGVSVLALEILSVVCQYWGRVGLAVATNRIVLFLRQELFRKLTQLPMSYFDSQPLGRTITRLTNDVEGIEEFFGGTLARLLTAILNIALVFIAMLATDVKFGLIVVASSIPAIIFTVVFRSPVRDWLRTNKRRAAHTNAMLAEFLNGLGIIKVFGLENWTMKRFDKATQDLYTSGLGLLNWNSFIRPLAMLLCTFPLLIILWVGGQGVLAGTLSIGLVVAFVRFSERFSQPIRVVSQEVQVIQEALTSSERVRQLLLESEESQVLGADGTKELVLAGNVTFSNVHMSYAPNGREILRGVSFVARAGEKVALVGATGSGKTSTLSLLPRLYEFSHGDVLLDGVSVREIRRRSLRSQLGMVTQDIIIFRGSLRDNLRGACENWQSISDQTILHACQQSGLLGLVNRLKGGLDTFIYEGGENLSMGERQLVAFTRMLIRNPAILILDEATANVDEACEQLIQRATYEALKNRTCFVIAHRLSTILQCDRILVFQAGQIIEQGSHDQLMATASHYRDLVRQQLGSNMSH